MNRKFSSLLLTGKTASLPFIVQQAQADVTPSYTDILSANVSVIEMPISGKLQLNAISTSTSSTYGSTYSTYDAVLCSSSLPSSFSVVVTGAKQGDNIYLVASSDTGGYEYLHPSIKVGKTNLAILASAAVVVPAGSTSAISIPINISALQQAGISLAKGGKFYLQALALPSGNFENGRYSELDTISVGTFSSSGTYSGACSY